MLEVPQHHPIQSAEHSESSIQSLDEISQTPLHKIPADKKGEIVAETFHFFKDFLEQSGFAEHTSPTETYQHLGDQNLVARREDPRNIFPLLSSEEGYEIDFEDARYANCVAWNPAADGPKGLYNAYMEGFASMNGVVSIVAFEQQDGDDLIAMEDSIQNFYGLDRSRVRSYKGSVTNNRIRLINLRIPGHLFPETEMTEDELNAVDEYLFAQENGKKADPVMIHRCYTPIESDEIRKAA